MICGAAAILERLKSIVRESIPQVRIESDSLLMTYSDEVIVS